MFWHPIVVGLGVLIVAVAGGGSRDLEPEAGQAPRVMSTPPPVTFVPAGHLTTPGLPALSPGIVSLLRRYLRAENCAWLADRGLRPTIAPSA